MTDWVNVEKFKEEAFLFLNKFGLNGLRSYGRKVGLRAATKLKKKEVILQTIAVLCGEEKTAFTNRGAPRKNESIPPELIAGMDELIGRYLYGEVPMPTPAPVVQEEKKEVEKPYYTITVQKGNGEKVMSLGTSLDFQILISNQKSITSAELTTETSENT
ncbi:MAG: hypothetical protein J6B56_04485 [Clostridia bacterium]|nr:hypothetical protein [Clostridia bacterium]